MTHQIQSIAIAGAWGYIGRKLLDAATELGLTTYACDPGPMPEDVDPAAFTRIGDLRELCQLDVDLFHLALHPQHRAPALEVLLRRAQDKPLLILNEKPMAEPEDPAQCRATIQAVEATRALMLFDFLELFDPMTHAITDYLAEFDQVKISEVSLYRGKDREDPERPRNYKKMVHIQYQESVHCLAFLLNLLGSVEGDMEAVFDGGLTATAEALPYSPPNPQDYPYVVDGQVIYKLQLGDVQVDGRTDFKSGAPFSKRKVIRGMADGQPFTIEADHLEGSKYLRINGQDQGFAPDASAYQHIIRTLGNWSRNMDPVWLMHGAFPNPRFARLTYQLSSVLWRSSFLGESMRLESCEELIRFQADFAEAVPRFGRYGEAPR
jgi:predicted dehydrogenase